METQTKVTGVILAGGLARRMNRQDKGLLQFNGRPLVTYAIAALKPACTQVVISANRNLEQYRQFGLPVIPDLNVSFDGPLAGILAAMSFVKSGILLIVPCDSPFITSECLEILAAKLVTIDADIAVASDGQRIHPVFLAVKTDLQTNLADYLARGGRRIDTWLNLNKATVIDFSETPSVFSNINTLADLALYEGDEYNDQLSND